MLNAFVYFDFLNIGDIEKAVERFEKALKRAPDNKELVLILGALYRQFKKTTKKSSRQKSKLAALKYLKQATDLDAKNPEAQIEMAEMQQAAGTDQHYRTALKHYRKGEREMTKSGDAIPLQIHNNQGVLHFQLGAPQRSMEAYTRAFAEIANSNLNSSSSSTSSSTSTSSTTSASSSSTPSSLRAVTEKYSNIMYNSENITLTYNFARLCESSTEIQLAKEIYIELSTKYPMYVESILRLAQIASNNNEIDQALSHVYDALCIHPANKDALSMQGNMYLQQGDVRMAQGK